MRVCDQEIAKAYSWGEDSRIIPWNEIKIYYIYNILTKNKLMEGISS